jgi:hypothetical protein
MIIIVIVILIGIIIECCICKQVDAVHVFVAQRWIDVFAIAHSTQAQHSGRHRKYLFSKMFKMSMDVSF